MKLADLAKLMGKSIPEVEAMLNEQDVVSISLTEKKSKSAMENGKIEVM